MLKAERQEAIKNLAKENEIVSWEMLRTYLDASKATVWRDIDEMEQKGMARKTRGGVIFPRTDRMETSNEMRKYRHPDAKTRIARAALAYISDHDFIMLDSGSTVLELARQIPEHQPVRVVTYYYEAAQAVVDHENTDVFLLGGEMRKGFYTCHGFMAEKMLEYFHAKTCFLGADGVDLQAGLTGYNSLDVPLKQIMIEQSERVILLCDHTKLETRAFVHIAPLEKIDILITDSGIDHGMVKAFREKNIEVIVAD